MARLMVVYREGPFRVAHKRVRDLPEFLRPGDVLVFNESKVIPARLLARKPTGERWRSSWCGSAPRALGSPPGPREEGAPGTRLLLLSPKDLAPVPGLQAEVVAVEEDGVRLLRFQGDLVAHLEEVGEVPLPPTSRPRSPWSATRRSTPGARGPWPPPPPASTSPRSFWKDFVKWGGASLPHPARGPRHLPPGEGGPREARDARRTLRHPRGGGGGREPGQGGGAAGRRRGHHGGPGPGERLPGRGRGGGGRGETRLFIRPLHLQGG